MAWTTAWAAGRTLPREEAIALALAPPPAEDERTPAATGDNRAGLSTREVEVLGLVTQGLTNAQVAARLFLSPRTVDQHLRSIYNKLGVGNRAAATRFAIEQTLVREGR
jgi:DNA-binding NarL/FixJ family response regulator